MNTRHQQHLRPFTPAIFAVILGRRKEKIAPEVAAKIAGVNSPLLSIHIYLLLLAMAMSHQHICHNTMSSLVVLETSDGYPYISKRIESMLA
jgi:hypothetical protein